jgi:hypothetical protein
MRTLWKPFVSFALCTLLTGSGITFLLAQTAHKSSIPPVSDAALMLSNGTCESEAGACALMGATNLLRLTECVQFANQQLGIKRPQIIVLSADSAGFDTFGYSEPWHQPSIHVYVRGRSLVDIARTIVHELVHIKQAEEGQEESCDESHSDATEDEANAKSMALVRKFGWLMKQQGIDIYHNSHRDRAASQELYSAKSDN